MLNPQAETLIITSKCSGGCGPCPFGSGLLPQRFLPAEMIVERLCSSAAPLVVLTGGEPLEHPEFSEIVELLAARSTDGCLAPFRIATGGHIAFSEIDLKRLKNITSFTGISLGTDVLSEVCSKRAEHSLIWNQNVQLFNLLGFPYSLTLTLHEPPRNALPASGSGVLQRVETDCEKLKPLMRAKELGASPEYLYLRISATGAASEEFYDEFQRELGEIRVLFDRF